MHKMIACISPGKGGSTPFLFLYLRPEKVQDAFVNGIFPLDSWMPLFIRSEKKLLKRETKYA